MKDKVSIIVPIYNVEKYLDKCIASLVNQTYKNCEIILVDDGSTDSSSKICDEWGKKSKKISVYHKLNGGISDARNYGIDKSTGNFIMFVDGDDSITSDCVEYLLKILKDYDADISIGSSSHVYEDNFIIKKSNKIKKEKIYLYNKYLGIKNMLYENTFSTGANMKLYKRNLFLDVRYPVGKIFEDLFTTYKLIYKSNCIVVSNKKIYNYLIRMNSIIGSINPQKNNDFYDASVVVYKFVKNKMPAIIDAAEYKIFVASLDLFVHYPNDKKLLTDEDYKNMNLYWSNIRKYRIKFIFNKYSSLKYKIYSCISFLGKNSLNLFYSKISKR